MPTTGPHCSRRCAPSSRRTRPPSSRSSILGQSTNSPTAPTSLLRDARGARPDPIDERVQVFRRRIDQLRHRAEPVAGSLPRPSSPRGRARVQRFAHIARCSSAATDAQRCCPYLRSGSAPRRPRPRRAGSACLLQPGHLQCRGGELIRVATLAGSDVSASTPQQPAGRTRRGRSRLRQLVGAALLFLAVTAGSITVALLVTPMQQVSAAGQTTDASSADEAAHRLQNAGSCSVRSQSAEISRTGQRDSTPPNWQAVTPHDVVSTG